MKETLKACAGIVKGRVQGVGFRYFTRRQAERLNLSGWVLNRSDGDVQFHVEGPAALVADFLRCLEYGPRYGRVDQLLVQDSEPAGLEAFQVRYP